VTRSLGLALPVLWASAVLFGVEAHNVCWDPVPGATEYRLYVALLEYEPVSFCDPDTGFCWTEYVTSRPVWTDCDVQSFGASVCTTTACCATMIDPVWSAFYFMTARNTNPGSESGGGGRTAQVQPCP